MGGEGEQEELPGRCVEARKGAFPESLGQHVRCCREVEKCRTGWAI